MQKIGSLIQQQPQSNELQKSSGQPLKVAQEQQLSSHGKTDISVFSDQSATIEQVGVAMSKMAIAFPAMEPAFFNLLSERIVKTRMSARRLTYAIDHVLDNFRYKQLTIADIMSIDVRCTIYSPAQMARLAYGRKNGSNDFARIKISNQTFWVEKSDKELYRLPDEL